MPRMRTLLGGRAIFNRGQSTIDCVVRNLSVSGALLQLPEPLSLPEEFELEINGKGRRLPASVVRRTAKGVGVTFAEAL